MEVRSEFAEQLSFGATIPDATRHVLTRFSDLLRDPNDGPVVIVCLAALHLRHADGAVAPVVRDAAIQLIDIGDAERAWRSDDFQARGKRRELLGALREVLSRAPEHDEED